MAKGGARARSGPPPDPNSLTQADGEWTVLPAAGRQGDPPEWPLVDPTERELELWAIEWSRPQAVMWERERQMIGVAMYVRQLVDAERPDATTASRTLLKQLREDLGVSNSGLLRNRWRISEVEPAEGADGHVPDGDDPRARFRVVAGGGA